MSDIKFHSPSQTLDAENAIDDLRIMTGYIWSIKFYKVFTWKHSAFSTNEYYHKKHFKESFDNLTAIIWKK